MGGNLTDGLFGEGELRIALLTAITEASPGSTKERIEPRGRKGDRNPGPRSLRILSSTSVKLVREGTEFGTTHVFSRYFAFI